MLSPWRWLHTRYVPGWCRVASTAIVVWVGAVSLAEAQRGAALGPAKCIDCHDHEKHAAWWKKTDGTIKAGKVINHFNSLNRLAADRAATEKYAKALNLSEDDAYAPDSACMKCHATVYKRQPRAGVSCESCHGGGVAYLDIHKEKDSYKKAVAAGMLDIIGQPDKWAPECMKCHVVDDQRLINAKHPSGDDFDLAQKFQAVAKHWDGTYGKNTGYAPASVAAAGAATRRGAIARRAATPAAPAAPAEAPAPAAAPAPPPTPSPTAVPAPPAPAPPPPAPAPTAPSAGSAPPAAPPGTGRAAGGTGQKSQPVRSNAPARPAVEAPPPISTPTPPVPAPVDPVAAAGGPGRAPVPPTPLPPTPAGIVASLQGRLVALLGSLLESGARAPTRVTPPDQPTGYTGADADLLRLQEEAIALALEALSIAPTTPSSQGGDRPK